MSVTSIRIDPAAKKKISFDWDDWIAREGTTLASSTITSSSGVTTTGKTTVGAIVTVMTSATTSGSVVCHAVFADGQEDEKTMTIIVEDQ